MGRPFAAIIHITDEQKVEFDFGNDEEDEEPPDFSGQEPVGKCLACTASVFEHGMRYVCEKTPEKKCKFSTGKVILQREMSREEVAKLLETGKTDLLEKIPAVNISRPHIASGHTFVIRMRSLPHYVGNAENLGKFVAVARS